MKSIGTQKRKNLPQSCLPAMPQSKEDKKGLQRYLQEVLASPEAGPELAERARHACPGEPERWQGRGHSVIVLTAEQRNWAKETLRKERWSQLGKDAKRKYLEDKPTAAASSSSTAPPAPTVSRHPRPKPGPKKKRKAAKKALGRPKKVWNKLTRRRLAHKVASSLQTMPSDEEAADLLLSVVKRLGDKWPHFGATMSEKCRLQQAAVPCDCCSKLMSGLGGLPSFQSRFPAGPVYKVRRSIDALVRTTFGKQSVCTSLGYEMGRKRWQRAGEPWKEPLRRGRGSKVMDESLVDMVRESLSAHSQPSSNVVFHKHTGDFTVTQTLQKDKLRIFEDSDTLAPLMSESTMRRICKRHCREFKNPQNQSDYCQYCFDLDRKALPKVRKCASEARTALTQLLPQYFQNWDVFDEANNLAERPGLRLKLFRHFINRHASRQPCREHRDGTFPCGQGSMRQRGSGFPQNLGTTLHETEAKFEFELQNLQKALDSYLFHRASNQQQRPCLDLLMSEPPPGRPVLLVDFKELLTLPLAPVSTSEMFYATGRHEVSTFGGILFESIDGRVGVTHILVFSSILDHTACRANVLIDLCLQQWGHRGRLDAIDIIADAGLHFRSYESLYHHLVEMPNAWGIPVCCHYGVEKHMKSAADRLFGMLNGWLSKAIRNGATLVTIPDLVAMVKAEYKRDKNLRPNLKDLIVLHDESPKPAPGRRLLAKDFHISRTYCVGSVPKEKKPWSKFGVAVTNYIFSTQQQGVSLTTDLYDEPVDGSSPDWRRGYYGPGQGNWATDPKPLDRHTDTCLTRRQKVVSPLLPEAVSLRHRAPLSDAEIAAKRARWERSNLRRKELREGSASSSSSSSTSSSEDDS